MDRASKTSAEPKRRPQSPKYAFAIIMAQNS
jgi:hypothetical protein